jgi:recombination protein RecR
MEDAVEQLATLPSIGKRTALRLVLQLLNRKPDEIERFAQAFITMKAKVKHCATCGNISDEDLCFVCVNPQRTRSIICVVEDVRDVMAIENTGQFKGIYHVLGGKISPIDGIGPSQLKIVNLVEKVNSGTVKEIIFALSSTMEGDTTNFYIYKQIKNQDVTTSTIARGISVGDELEYADEVTLGRSILQRVPFENSFKNN